MTIKSEQVLAGTFFTQDATGAITPASVTPTGTLYIDGVANAATITITGSNPYKWSLTLPALTAGQRAQVYITAIITGVTTGNFVASEQADTALISEVKVKTDLIPASPAPADEYDADFTQVVELLYSIMGGEAWTDETLVTIQAAIEAISGIDEAGVRNAIGLATANLDTQLAGIPKGTTVYDGKTLTELTKLVAAVLLGKLSGGGTGTLAFRDIADTKDRVITEVDLATGDRTAQTLDGA